MSSPQKKTSKHQLQDPTPLKSIDKTKSKIEYNELEKLDNPKECREHIDQHLMERDQDLDSDRNPTVGEILRLAQETHNEREDQYGDILNGFADTSTIWWGLLRAYYEPLLGIELPPLPIKVAAAMMAGMKLGRLSRPNPPNLDDAIDGAVYAATAGRASAAGL